MLESRVRSQQPKKKSSRYQSRYWFGKHKKLVLLIFCSGFGSLILRGCVISNSQRQLPSTPQSSSIIELRNLPPTARASQLKVIAEVDSRQEKRSVVQDRLRARYLLGADLIKQNQGKLALTYLQGLGQDYPLLRPQILFKIAQAQQQNQRSAAAQRTLKYLIKSYPNAPITANALLLLSENRTQNETRLIGDFPYHPLSQNIARQRLKDNPDRFPLLLLLAKYSRDSDVNKIRDRLVLNHPAKLTPEDWQAIADGYWREEEHRKAADAYLYAPSTPGNLYRAARGFHRNGNIATAKRAYQRLLEEYHDAREAGEALVYLASISSGDEAVVYLEKAIAKFPSNAPEAYRSKAIVHERFAKHQQADLSRQNLLNKHANSSAAAEYRWKIARKLAANGSKQDAWQWMQPLVESNHVVEQNFAPKALYWAGKWAKDIGKLAAAETTFSKIIREYPQSYWAWRSAVMLGWDVGDFDRLRAISPSLDLKSKYSPLPIESTAFQELHLLGQYEDARSVLRSQIQQHQELSVNEQFSEGVLKIALGEYSTGMQEIWDLTKRETPQELADWKALRQTNTYWHNLFPFPYENEILQYSRQEEINPLLVISVMRKESTFNPEIDSVVGAVGLMQIVPPTADWVAEQIDMETYSLTNPEDNIKIGTWYLNHNHHRYQDSSLYAVASYNAGTGNVSAWLNRYDTSDPDSFVEQIPFPETKDYVEGVFGNYWNYLRLYNPTIRQKMKAIAPVTEK